MDWKRASSIFWALILGARASAPAEPNFGYVLPGSPQHPLLSLSRVDVLSTLPTSVNDLQCGCLDKAGAYAYLGSRHEVLKLNLGDGDAPPTLVGSASFAVLHQLAGLSGCIIDPDAGYAYFVRHAGNAFTGSTSLSIAKVSLGDGDAPPTITAEVMLQGSDSWFWWVVGDPDGQFAYVGLDRGGGNLQVAMVDLGLGAAPPTVVGEVALPELPSDRFYIRGAGIDPDTRHLFVPVSASVPAGTHLHKLKLGTGAALPTVEGTTMLTDWKLSPYDSWPAELFHNAAAGTLHVAAANNTFGLLAVQGGGDGVAPALLGSAALSSRILSGDFIPATHRMLALSYTGPNPASGAPLVLSVIDTESVEGTARVETAVVVDPAQSEHPFLVADPAGTKRAYVMQNGTPRVIEYNLDPAPEPLLNGSPARVFWESVAKEMRFRVHSAGGNVRLGIYTDAPSMDLLWESPEVPIATGDGEVSVPISAGTPPVLILPPGDYILAWQADVPSQTGSFTFTPTFETGFSFARPYGALPSQIGSVNRIPVLGFWTQYVTLFDGSGTASSWAEYD